MPPHLPATVRRLAISTASRLETGVRDRLSRLAARRGWTSAVIPYPGYATGSEARVLGRLVLSPAHVDPAASRGIRAWRRLLTLESPHTEVRIDIAGASMQASSDAAGIVDARIPLPSPSTPGTAHASLRLPQRDRVQSVVHVVGSEPTRGVVCDIDDTAWVTGISHPLRAAWRTLRGSSASRTAVPGMAALLHAATDGERQPAVVYLSNGPWNFAGPVERFLQRHGFPPGAILMTDWGILPHRWFRDGQEHKRSSLARLLEDMPHVEWTLVGDDGEHDPVIYTEVARAHPDAVAAIALRTTRPVGGLAQRSSIEHVEGVPVARGADGDALLTLLEGVGDGRTPRARTRR